MKKLGRTIWRFCKQTLIGLIIATSATAVVLIAYQPAFEGALIRFMALAPEPLGEHYLPSTFQITSPQAIAEQLTTRIPSSPQDLANSAPVQQYYHSLFVESVLLQQQTCRSLLIAKHRWHGFWFTIEREGCQ
ncbi:hypothetical protein [Salinibius halmophilus]|uniref:hypothetical protein n=1 Tax=Salinibius halmophilus TaxID=1853216 RepID=UPI000E676512|nr:hypothetical protein [Salinibius halmophilus]